MKKLDIISSIIFGVIIAILLVYVFPLAIVSILIAKYDEQIVERAKISHTCVGVITYVDSGEEPEYTKWKSEDSNGVRLWLQPTNYTTLHFKDGRVKKFAEVPDFEIPLDKLVTINYDGDGYKGWRAVTDDGRQFVCNWETFPESTSTPTWDWNPYPYNKETYMMYCDARQAVKMAMLGPYITTDGQKAIPIDSGYCNKHDYYYGYTDKFGCYRCEFDKKEKVNNVV